MVFLNSEKSPVIWINPNIFCHRVKIYLPANAEGEKSMMRSIVGFFKLWLLFDQILISQAQTLPDLLALLQPTKIKIHKKSRSKSPIECLRDHSVISSKKEDKRVNIKGTHPSILKNEEQVS